MPSTNTSDNGYDNKFDFAKIGIQPKLKISQPGDAYEQEADKVAEQAMRVLAPVTVGPIAATKEAQTNHKCTSCKTKEEERDQEIDRKPSSLNGVTTRSGTDLDDGVHHYMSLMMGFNFSDVQIHADTKSAEMANALNADAFTVGRDIYFGVGKLQPGTKESNQLLAHELAHVEQQSRTGIALQPKLRFTGQRELISRVVNFLNNHLHGYRVSVNKSEVSIEQFTGMQLTGAKTNPQQQALANRLTNIIDDPDDVTIAVTAGGRAMVGDYALEVIDIADIEVLGIGSLIHEIEEQYQKQVKSLPFGSETTGAHAEAIKAESEVMGARRGPQTTTAWTQNPDGTIDQVLEIPFTYPGGKVKTMIVTFQRSNIVSVRWRS